MARDSADINKLILMQQIEIQNALPEGMSATRMGTIARTAMKRSVKLAQCSDVSILGSLMLCFQLGLEPNTPLGHAYLVPIKGTCELWVGYKGHLKLAYASGAFKYIGAREVYANDAFHVNYGMNPSCTHEPKPHPIDEKPIGYYATYTTTSGGSDVVYMTYAEVECHGKKYSKTYGSGPWTKDFDEMAKKTVLRKILKYAPMSVEVAKAHSYEQKPVVFKNGLVLPSDEDAIETEATETVETSAGNDMEAGIEMIKKLATPNT